VSFGKELPVESGHLGGRQVDDCARINLDVATPTGAAAGDLSLFEDPNPDKLYPLHREP
jgi:hypothetical protein